MRSRSEQEERGSKGEPRRRESTRSKSKGDTLEDGKGCSIRKDHKKSWRTGFEETSGRIKRKTALSIER